MLKRRSREAALDTYAPRIRPTDLRRLPRSTRPGKDPKAVATPRRTVIALH